MKLLITIVLCFVSTFVLADEYRYNLMVTTGLQERVFDQAGKETTILFSGKSDEEARFVLTQILELGGINGTKGAEDWNGVPLEQTIILKGTLNPQVQRTQSAPNTAGAEDYQVFLLEALQVRFPMMRVRSGILLDTGYLETHFSFDTLFPKGLKFDGVNVDFDKYTSERENEGGSERVTIPVSDGQGKRFAQPELDVKSQ